MSATIDQPATTPTITVTSTGPVISGTTQNVEAGRGVWISNANVGVGATVQSDGSWSRDMSDQANLSDGDTLNVYVENNAGSSASASLTYTAGDKATSFL